MNSDLTPAQNTTATNNPQALQQSIPGSRDASSFQKAAGTDVLNQNHTLQVVSTGKPIADTKTSASHGVNIWLILVIIAAVIAAKLFYVKFKRTPAAKDAEGEEVVVKKVTSKVTVDTPAPAKPKLPKGKKKQPRSKRHK